MKVGVNTLFMIPGVVGGTETYLRRTLCALVAGNPRDEFVLFTTNDNREIFQGDLSAFENVDFDWMPFSAANRTLRIIREQTRLPARARSAGLDVLWSAGYTAPIRCPCPQVVTIHDMQYKSHPEDMSTGYRLATDILVRAAAVRCQGIIAVSNFTKTEILRYTSAPSEKVWVTPEAADPIYSEPVSESEKQSVLSGLRDVHRPFILSVSNTYPHKNMHALVSAYARVMDAIPHALVIVGSPRRGERKLQASMAQIHDSRRVVRLQRLSPRELRVLYQSASVFALPSLYEGFGLPVLEAMMAGVPVIAAPRASVPEVGGGQVVYFDPDHPDDLAERLREVIAWPEERRQAWAVDSRTHALGYSWDRTAAATMGVLRRVASAHA